MSPTVEVAVPVTVTPGPPSKFVPLLKFRLLAGDSNDGADRSCAGVASTPHATPIGLLAEKVQLASWSKGSAKIEHGLAGSSCPRIAPSGCSSVCTSTYQSRACTSVICAAVIGPVPDQV